MIKWEGKWMRFVKGWFWKLCVFLSVIMFYVKIWFGVNVWCVVVMCG